MNFYKNIKLMFITLLVGFNMGLSQTSYSGDLNFYY